MTHSVDVKDALACFQMARQAFADEAWAVWVGNTADTPATRRPPSSDVAQQHLADALESITAKNKSIRKICLDGMKSSAERTRTQVSELMAASRNLETTVLIDIEDLICKNNVERTDHEVKETLIKAAEQMETVLVKEKVVKALVGSNKQK